MLCAKIENAADFAMYIKKNEQSLRNECIFLKNSATFYERLYIIRYIIFTFFFFQRVRSCGSGDVDKVKAVSQQTFRQIFFQFHAFHARAHAELSKVSLQPDIKKKNKKKLYVR